MKTKTLEIKRNIRVNVCSLGMCTCSVSTNILNVILMLFFHRVLMYNICMKFQNVPSAAVHPVVSNAMPTLCGRLPTDANLREGDLSYLNRSHVYFHHRDDT